MDQISEALSSATKDTLDQKYAYNITDMYKQVAKNVTEVEEMYALKDDIEKSVKEVKDSIMKARGTLIAEEESAKLIDSMEAILHKAMEIDHENGKEHRLPYRSLKK
jgi:hypothetical protein